jgi:hypothetical protein
VPISKKEIFGILFQIRDQINFIIKKFINNNIPLFAITQYNYGDLNPYNYWASITRKGRQNASNKNQNI